MPGEMKSLDEVRDEFLNLDQMLWNAIVSYAGVAKRRHLKQVQSVAQRLETRTMLESVVFK